ncbi:MAG: mechanosensitive ion channel [Dehalococcoidia bacterium]|nr:mechanosensitive ion channel [Dehalococcoidia bacterium]
MQIELTRDEWIETAIAAGVVVGVLVLAFLFTALVIRLVRALLRRTKSGMDDQVAAALRVPFILLAGIWGVAGALFTISYISQGDERWITRMATALTVLVVTFSVRRVLVIMLEWQAARPGSKGKLHPGSLPLIRRGVTILVFAAGFLVVLDTLGLAISPLLAGLGIGGLAVALALQPLLGNVFASSYMLSDSSIRIGDYIEMRDGPTGMVDDIGWRATRIRSFDNNIVIVPNSALADALVTNFTLTSLEASAGVELGVSYDEDLSQVETICREVLTTLRDEWPTSVKVSDPVVSFTGFGDSRIGVLLKLQSQTWSDSFGLRHEMIKRIHARFTVEGITMNYPTRRVLLQPGDVAGLAPLAMAEGNSVADATGDT